MEHDASANSARLEFLALAAELRSGAAAYYSGDGRQTMDDATYDAGIRQLRAAAEANGWTEADDLLYEVAGGQSDGDVPHARPMLSLDNAMDYDELQSFLRRVAAKTGIAEDDLNWVVEPKLDGMALSVRYIEGVLDRVVTRGNGLAGEDVTRLARNVVGIPSRLDVSCSVVVVGECVMTHSDFAEANRMRLEHGDHAFANPRNAVAGSLRSKHRSYEVPMTFIAYGIDDPEGEINGSHVYEMAYCASLGFIVASTVLGHNPTAVPVLRGTDAILDGVADIEQDRADFNMDTDGAVIKANDRAVRVAMGEGSRSPRWAIAKKFAPDTRETDLLDIVVAVGRTGNLSFTAKVAPVSVGGVTIESVTVHNVSEIARKGLRLPGPDGTAQRVVVRRAGEVIPEIVGVADTGPGEGETRAFEPPAQCPNGHDLDTDSIIWKCVQGRVCGAAAGIRYAVGRDCLDIEGMGTQIVDSLVEAGKVSTVADLFWLTEKSLLGVPRLGPSNAAKLMAQIDKARSVPLDRLVAALGIRGTGRSMSRRIAARFGSMDAIRLATAEQMAEVEGIGSLKAQSIVAELTELAPMIDKMAGLGVLAATAGARIDTPTLPSPVEGAGLPLAGMAVCVTGAMTGALEGMSRNEVSELIESLGGRAASSVSAKTSLLLTDDPESGTGKAKKARELGIEIVSPDEFAGRYMGGDAS
jgi:DNA ligase (NAD+)